MQPITCVDRDASTIRAISVWSRSVPWWIGWTWLRNAVEQVGDVYRIVHSASNAS